MGGGVLIGGGIGGGATGGGKAGGGLITCHSTLNSVSPPQLTLQGGVTGDQPPP